MVARQWWNTSLIPVLGRQKQSGLCEFKVSLVYGESCRTGSKVTKKFCLEKHTNKKIVKEIQLVNTEIEDLLSERSSKDT